MSKWLMLVVLVLVVLTAAMGLKNIATASGNSGITAPSWMMAPNSAPAPAVPWGLAPNSAPAPAVPWGTN